MFKAFILVASSALALKRLEYSVILLIPLVFYFSYVDFMSVAFWNYLTVIVSATIFIKWLLGGKITIDKDYLFFISVGITFLLFHLVRLQYEVMSVYDQLNFLLQYVSTFLLTFCVVCSLDTSFKWRRYYFLLVVFVGLSALIGVFQYFQLDWAWQLRGFFTDHNDLFMSKHLAERQRISGLSYYNITLTYQLIAAFPMAVALSISSQPGYFKYFSILLSVYIAFSLVLSESKSALLGLAVGLVVFLPDVIKKINLSRYLSIQLHKQKLVYVSVLVVLMLAAFQLYSSIEPLSLSRGNAARFPLWLLGYLVYSHNPFGMLSEYFFEVDRFKVYFIDWTGYEYFLKSYSHNQFINTLTFYGIIGFSLLLVFYGVVIKKIFSVLNSNKYQKNTKLLVKGLFAYLISYWIHSSFHNAGPFFRDVVHWFVLSLIFALPKNQKSNEVNHFAI